LREQWMSELGERFGIEAIVIDTREARRRAAQLPPGVSPWITAPVIVSSVEYVRRPEVARAVQSCRWDAVVVDEAHRVTPGTDRHRAVSALCRRIPYVILLTATPHSGEQAAFESLCHLGALRGDRLLVFRRNRKQIVLGHRRRVHQLRVRLSAAEHEMHASLDRLLLAVRPERHDDQREVWLAMAMLRKRALSSAWSLERSVRRKLESASWMADQPHQSGLPFGQENDELGSEDEAPTWNTSLLANDREERSLLEAISTRAAAAQLGETKMAALGRLLRRLRRLREPAIVFTEYRDTLLHVRQRVAPDCAFIHGGIGLDDRRATLERFMSGGCPLLLTTDAASEGLNLHRTCRVVINLELPWSPTRLEQRIGRVDRIGQTRAVHAFHLIARDSHEMEILARLQHRVSKARAEMDGPDPLGMPFEPEENLDRLRVPVAALDRESRFECERVARIRTLVARCRTPARLEVPERRLAVFTRRRSLRAALGARFIALVQTVAEDAFGRIVASHVTPLVIATAHHLELERKWESLIPTLEALPLDSMDASLAVWKEATVRSNRMFWSERCARERAIARSSGSQLFGPIQADLFDHRADRERQRWYDDERAHREQAIRHAAAARTSARLQIQPPFLALILIPAIG
jgi:superfamily II DNA or RNA helicase